MPYLAFISHAACDRWVAGQLEKELRGAGAECFLDSTAIETGDEFDVALKRALHAADELLVLLTPSALDARTCGSRSGSHGSRGFGSSACCTG